MAVIQDCFPGKPAEDLVLVRLNKKQVGVGIAVQDRREVHLEAGVIAAEFPGFQKTVGGDVEFHLIKFMNFPVKEN